MHTHTHAHTHTQLTKNVTNFGLRKSGKRGEDHQNLQLDLLLVIDLLLIRATIDLLLTRAGEADLLVIRAVLGRTRKQAMIITS